MIYLSAFAICRFCPNFSQKEKVTWRLKALSESPELPGFLADPAGYCTPTERAIDDFKMFLCQANVYSFC
jgi:hypothetical protein